jgi:GPH family glycoside/pentoside/hexuronide:cation symporter
MSAAAHKPVVSRSQIVAFTIGDLGIHVPFMSTVLFLMYFYTEVVGLSAATAGLMFMIASIWDALIDPPMGLITDRTRSRWGRCRPYFLFGCVPLAISLVLVFYVPPLHGGALVAYLLGANMLFRTCFTIVGIPYAAYSARITQDSQTRTTIAGYKLFFTIGAGSLVAYFALPLANHFGEGNLARGFYWTAMVFAVAPLVFLPVTFLGTREPAQAGPQPASLTMKDYLAFFRSNLAFWIVLACITCVIATQVIGSAVTLYFFKYYLRDETSAPLALTLSMVVGLVITPLWVLMERRVGKRSAWMFGSLGALGVLTYFALNDSISSIQYVVVVTLLNGSLYGLTVTMWSMLPDTIEYGEWRSGVRAESITFGLALFVLKVAMGIATGIFGFALNAIGFQPGIAQSAATLADMKMLATAFPALLVALSLVAAHLYPMRRGDHERIVEQLAARKSGSVQRAIPLATTGQPGHLIHTRG